nr:ThuA domain-containing protein [bacterium]
MGKALIVQGGWPGHDPVRVAALYASFFEEIGFDVTVSDTQDSFADAQALKALDVIVPIWTMGTIEPQLRKNISDAVISGVGLSGCHGGMCDAFRNDVDWQFMTGANWVAHPGNDTQTYRVEFLKAGDSPIIEGLEDFEVTTEQYYLHCDPVNHVLATTRFPTFDGPHAANGPVDMPVAWTRRWGKGRIFYCSLGHQVTSFDNPNARELLRRGSLWAARQL